MTNMTDWQPIITAPREGDHILLYICDRQLVGYWSDAGWVHSAPGLPLVSPYKPTHWMPLPPPPTTTNA